MSRMTDTARIGSERRTVPLSDLRPHPRNYQQHPPDQIEHIKKSLVDFGQYKNIVVARDLTILAGHGVVEAITALGWDTADVKVLDLDPDDLLALRLVAGDNEISNLADVNDRALTELLREIGADPLVGLLGSGFDEMQLAALAMTTRPASELRDLTAAGEWLGLPGFRATPKEATLHISFLSTEARDAYIEEMGDRLSIYRTRDHIKMAYFPARPMNDLASLKFDVPTDA